MVIDEPCLTKNLLKNEEKRIDSIGGNAVIIIHHIRVQLRFLGGGAEWADVVL